eukprot:gene14454-15999_t
MQVLEVFQVGHLYENFSQCLINSEEQKKKALIGDALILLYFRRTFLKAYPDESIGFISEMTKIFIENDSMKLFLLSLAPEESRLFEMSSHSVGTVFEALLNDSTSPNSVLKLYFRLITKELNPELLVREMMRNTSEPAATVTESADFKKNIAEAFRSYKPKPKPKFHPAIMKPETLSLANYLHDNSKVETLQHKPNSVIQISWRSRKGYIYNDEFYTCCGANSSSTAIAFREGCLRNTWKNRNSVHTGSLKIDSSSKVGGGYGPTGSSLDHLPRCKSATWTCCYRDSLAEGCVDLYTESIPSAQITRVPAKRLISLIEI